ncbi:hypothetical protein ACFLW2_05440 [Chloroflexota bacterium]
MTDMQSPTVPRSQSVFGALVYWITIAAALMCIFGPLVAFIDLDSNVINPSYEMSNIFDGMKPSFDQQDLQDNATAGTQYLAVEDVEKFDDPEDVDREIVIRIMGKDGQVGELATLVAINKDTDMLEISAPLLNSYDAEQAEIAELTVWDARGNNSLASDAQAGTDSLTLESLGAIEDPTAERPIALMIQDKSNREQVSVQAIDRDANTISLTSPLSNSYSMANNASVTQITAAEEVEGHFWLDNLTNGDGLTQLGLVLGCLVGVPAMGGAALILVWKEKSWGWALAAMAIVILIIVPALGLV